MASYCANYYVCTDLLSINTGIQADWQKGSVNCHNTVSKFGDRCALCLVNLLSLKLDEEADLTPSQSNQVGTSSSRAMQNGVPQASEQWVENVKREELRREEETARRQRVQRTASNWVHLEILNGIWRGRLFVLWRSHGRHW